MTGGAEVTIRDSAAEDAAGLLAIYEHYVKNTAVTFEYDTPSLEEFAGRMARIMRRYPHFSAESAGTLIGYACAKPFVGRAAYDRSSELTIYLAPDARGRGIGRRLYERLEAALSRMGVLNLYACIAYTEAPDEYLTAASPDFHARLGFSLAGRFRKCGYKFGRWYDMIWMEKFIGDHAASPSPFTPYTTRC